MVEGVMYSNGMGLLSLTHAPTTGQLIMRTAYCFHQGGNRMHPHTYMLVHNVPLLTVAAADISDIFLIASSKQRKGYILRPSATPGQAFGIARVEVCD